MKIVFATNNAHKLSEIKSILGSSFEIVSLSDIGCTVDIPETGKTLEENAHIKAAYVFEHYGLSCFADDTGLEVEALHGAPGVYSARYAGGAGHDSEANMRKLLGELADEPHRNARFSTSSKASSQATLPPRNMGKRALVTTPSSSPTAIIRALPSWEKLLKTKSVIVHAPSNSWLFS